MNRTGNIDLYQSIGKVQNFDEKFQKESVKNKFLMEELLLNNFRNLFFFIRKFFIADETFDHLCERNNIINMTEMMIKLFDTFDPIFGMMIRN